MRYIPENSKPIKYPTYEEYSKYPESELYSLADQQARSIGWKDFDTFGLEYLSKLSDDDLRFNISIRETYYIIKQANDPENKDFYEWIEFLEKLPFKLELESRKTLHK